MHGGLSDLIHCRQCFCVRKPQKMFDFARKRETKEGRKGGGGGRQEAAARAKQASARGRDVINFDGFLWSL